MKLLVGSANPGKITEIREALSGLSLELLSASDVGIAQKPDETGTTYAANAELKARFYQQRAVMPTLADDSGIVVEAMQNELGIHTRRWGPGAGASDEEWIAAFLKRMEGEENRRARFVCCIAFLDDKGLLSVFEGRCDGIITPTLEAAYLPGLPISACFKPDGSPQVYSALSVHEKNRLSHRGKAVWKLRAHLVSLLPPQL